LRNSKLEESKKWSCWCWFK